MTANTPEVLLSLVVSRRGASASDHGEPIFGATVRLPPVWGEELMQQLDCDGTLSHRCSHPLSGAVPNVPCCQHPQHARLEPERRAIGPPGVTVGQIGYVSCRHQHAGNQDV